MNSKGFIRERIEELRSRISLLQSTMMRLKQNYWSVFKECMSSEKTPPFLFPTSAFSRLEQILSLLNLDIEPDYAHYAAIIQLNDIDLLCNTILGELNKLQETLNQRIIGLGTMNLIESHPILQVESSVLPKVYCAIDAVTFDLMNTTLGPSWIKTNKYIPISLLNSLTGGYTVHPHTLLITVPYHDSFRARFWPALAHEVAHILFDKIVEAPGPLLGKILRGTNKLKNILESYSSTNLFFINRQISELTSDILACYICPPTYLSAAINLRIPVDKPNKVPLFRIYPTHTHPPLDSRIAAMEAVLKLNGILDDCEIIPNTVHAVNNFFNRKNIVLPNNASYEFICDYVEFAKEYSRDITSNLPLIGINPFDSSMWKACHDLLTAGENHARPIQLLAIDWIKRLDSIKMDYDLPLSEYFNKRQREAKIFEYLVHNIYRFYEEMVEKITEERMFDIRVDLN